MSQAIDTGVFSDLGTQPSWDDVVARATAFRRDLHRHPELTWQEHQTASAIRAVLDTLSIPWRACAELGTLATLAPDAAGPHVALRGDIDALPIIERSGAQWTSLHEGKMHACGHDGHTATLMAAAAWLKAHEHRLTNPVTLLFQPAEEGGHGAKRMIEDGALKGIDRIFGWHNWPAIAFGRAVCPDGAVMSGNGTFDITLTGKGGHSSQPELARDPVLAASAVTMALQQIVARRLTPQHAAVMSVTSIDARSAHTVIPDRAIISGSIRIAQNSDRDIINALITEIAETTARSYGVEADVSIVPRYNATVNTPEAAAQMRTHLEAEFGSDWHAAQTPVPIMASEDFSYYLEQVPGAFALIGADDGNGHDFACHNPQYDFNDRLIPAVVRLFARLAGAPVPSSPA